MLTRSDDLEILLTVIDCESFSVAANALNMQVAKVSRAVSIVEKQLGISILNRTTRRLNLTDEGRLFAESIRLGLEKIKQAEAEIISFGESPRGRLRVDAASPFLFHQIIPLIRDFRAQYPSIEIELTSNEGYVSLLEKKTDVAIRIGPLSDSTLHARSLGRSPLYIVASSDYLAKRGIPKKTTELVNHDRLGFLSPKTLNDWPLKGFSSLTPTLSASNGETIRKLTLMGNGIACLSGFMVKKDILEGSLLTLLDDEKIIKPEREQVNAVFYKSSSVAKRISAFLDFIQPRLAL